ncbi:transglutaminase-like domain-containing protein [Clostridium carnis]
MSAYLPYGICILLIILALKGSIKDSLEERNAKYALNRLIYYFSVFITFLVMLINLDKVYLTILKLSNNLYNFNNLTLVFFKAFSLAICFLISQFIIYQILKALCSPLTKSYSLVLGRGTGRIVFFSSIFGTLKGFVIVLILFMSIITFNNTIGRNFKVNIFNGISAYSKLENVLSINKPVLNYSEIKNYIPVNSNVITYYNGVTLEQGVKSNKEIDQKAKELVANLSSDRERASRIYSWVGSNIEYDNKKAEKALSSKGIKNSGAIEAWNTRSGICFDYACLYVTMARSADLKVRLVTGEAFDGKNFGPHAWNEVYLSDEKRWIKIDPTFYLAGDYFDNEDFNNDHINESIAGEW